VEALIVPIQIDKLRPISSTITTPQMNTLEAGCSGGPQTSAKGWFDECATRTRPRRVLQTEDRRLPGDRASRAFPPLRPRVQLSGVSDENSSDDEHVSVLVASAACRLPDILSGALDAQRRELESGAPDTSFFSSLFLPSRPLLLCS